MKVTVKETQAAITIHCLGRDVQLKGLSDEQWDAISTLAATAHEDQHQQDEDLFFIAQELELMASAMYHHMAVKDADTSMALLEWFEDRLKACTQSVRVQSMKEREAARQKVINEGKGETCRCGTVVAKLSNRGLCMSCESDYCAY